MEVVYSDSEDRKPGKLYRSPSEFFGVISSATHVTVEGDHPRIVEAYRKAGIKVEADGDSAETDPLKMKVPDLKDWLTSKGIEFDASAKKEDLQALVPKE